MVRTDKNRVQQLEKELKGLAVPNHQYKYWKLKENLTKEQLINLERLLVKESRKTRKGEYKWSKEIKEIKGALSSLYPWLHPCCSLRNIREALDNDNYYQQIEQGGRNIIGEKQKKTPNNQLELAKYLSQALSDQHQEKEEKIAEIFAFCLDYLNQGVKEDWRKRKHKTQMLLSLAENEWKNTKKQIFKDHINKELIEKMEF